MLLFYFYCFLVKMNHLTDSFPMPSISFTTKESLQAWMIEQIQKQGPQADLNAADVSNIRDFSFLCISSELEEQRVLSQFNGDLSKWDMSNASILNYMFAGSVFNGDLSKWNVSNVTQMAGMFQESFFNQPLNSWDVSKVHDMRAMFFKSPFNQPLDRWNTSNAVGLSGMFKDCPFNQDISSWDVSRAQNMSEMFLRSSFNQPLSTWSVANVMNMARMFEQSSFNHSLEDWELRHIRNVEQMFFNSQFNHALPFLPTDARQKNCLNFSALWRSLGAPSEYNWNHLRALQQGVLMEQRLSAYDDTPQPLKRRL